jgi:hypothetical protein
VSDARLRELERRFRETGAPDDEAAWLRERLRAGELEERLLRLADRLRHPAAALALGTPAAPSCDEPPDDGAWFGAIATAGPAAFLRACVAVAGLEARDDESPRHLDRQALERLIEPFVVDPTEARRQAVAMFVASESSRRCVKTVVRRLLVQIMTHGLRVPPPHEDANARRLRRSAQDVGRLIPLPPDTPRSVPGGQLSTEDAARLARAVAVAKRDSERLVWQTVRADLLPWAVGNVDPLRTRVEARGAG